MGQLIHKLTQRVELCERLVKLQLTLHQRLGKCQIVAKSNAMRNIMSQVLQIAQSMFNVLISGETGTGKELIARAIHYLGPRAGKPFIVVDCGAIPENLIENELFGHIAGAYTGAGASCNGLFQEAEGGSLFFDEIESLPLAIQAKFLRFLQERQYKPLGQSKYISVDVRIIAATNVNLCESIESKNFRKDLYYRLNAIPLNIPPLRERKADIPALIHHFLSKYKHDSNNNASIPIQTVKSWESYNWPGNVRELENKIKEWLTIDHVQNEWNDPSNGDNPTRFIRPLAEVRKEAIARSDRVYLHNLLTHTNGNISAAAKLACFNRKSLSELLKKYEINSSLFKR